MPRTQPGAQSSAGRTPSTPGHSRSAVWRVSTVRRSRMASRYRRPSPAQCPVCHDTPNAGDHSVKAPLNIGVADPARAPNLPIYRLTNIHTGDVVSTTDPGRAMITGRWTDIGKFKGPVLRALAARPPYFHNGSARPHWSRLSISMTRDSTWA